MDEQVFTSELDPAPDAPVPDDIDWFGNTSLHHCFANSELSLDRIRQQLNENPALASMKNQFGRIPLHYALDRTKVDVDGVKLLLQIHPVGAGCQDIDGITPYDVAVRWKHRNAIKKLLLDIEPSLDRRTHLYLRYGCIVTLYYWATMKRPLGGNAIRLRVATDYTDEDQGQSEKEEILDEERSSSTRVEMESGLANYGNGMESGMPKSSAKEEPIETSDPSAASDPSCSRENTTVVMEDGKSDQS
ncbi:hypothetical protein B484DRAFT_460054 [Ochromonadaceae sp. CCMP2298]|nr:hypothetical protein B484DRAFT_460054 [Ochromonadaceae sp. CCMP2298]